MKLLLTGAYKYTDEQIEYLKSLGNEIIFIQDERAPIDIDVSDVQGVVCNSLFYYNDIEKFESLKYIQLISAGLDRVPLGYIKKSDIALYNARGVYSVPIAEFVVRGVLDIYKKAFDFYNKQKNHIWLKERFIPELFGKNILVIGAGSIGIEIAKRFKAFDTNVIGISRTGSSKQFFDKITTMNSLDEELKNADVVVLALPLTKDNEKFFNSSKFEIMKPSAVFVNVARGKLVDEEALTEALEQNKIFGGVIDVFDQEPLNENSPLWDMDNIILTPHNSFVGENNNKRMFDVISNNIKNW